jgi:hypothetical protein
MSCWLHLAASGCIKRKQRDGLSFPKIFTNFRHHQIATLDRTMRGDNLAAEEKYEKITRIFARSV